MQPKIEAIFATAKSSLRRLCGHGPTSMAERDEHFNKLIWRGSSTLPLKVVAAIGAATMARNRLPIGSPAPLRDTIVESLGGERFRVASTWFGYGGHEVAYLCVVEARCDGVSEYTWRGCSFLVFGTMTDLI